MSEIVNWEYRFETLGSAFSSMKDEEVEATLDEWGSQGWEVVTVYQPSGSNKLKILAKRPLTISTRRQRSWPG